MRLSVLGWLGCVSVVTACFGDAPPIDGDPSGTGSSTGSNGTDASMTETSSTPDTSGSSVDPSAPESSGESGSVSGTNTTDDTTEPVVPYCTRVLEELDGPYTECTDFEGDIEPWMLVDSMEGVVEMVEHPDAPSPVRVLSTSFPDTPEIAPEAYATLSTANVVLLSRLRFRMDLADCDGEVTFAVMDFADDSITASLLRTAGGELRLQINDADNESVDHMLHPDVVDDLEPWSEWELRVDVDAAYVDVLIDGVFAAQITDIAVPPSPSGPPSMRLGLARKTTGFACAAAFDDVLVY